MKKTSGSFAAILICLLAPTLSAAESTSLRLPMPEISRAARVECKAVKSSLVPEALHVSAEEAAAMTARNAADRAAAGYVERYPYHCGHYTSRLLKRFWDTHREYFGLMPNGRRGVDLSDWPPFFRGLSKACVSNEAVVDQKIADWVAAGKPQLFVCGEDDGLLGFCRCERCRALDADLPGERFVHHKTDRYINFWNRICAKAVKLRPDVMVTVFAYSVLRHPPRRERIAYPDNLRFSFIPTFHDADKLGMVAAWKQAGMKHFYLRPNYLCPRLHLPYGLERTIYDEVRAFMAAGASGFQFDGSMSIPVQKFEIYVTERLSSDPNVPFERIESDYCARYGAAAETVKAYHRRVRARCDREWPRLRIWMRENDLEFLDDGHICRYLDRLHTVDELEADLAILEKFDASQLAGEAARRFNELKVNARHYPLVKRALMTKSESDKKALYDFRVANRLFLGTGWAEVYKKGEVSLWFPGTKHEEYMKFGEEAFVERYERNLKPPAIEEPKLLEGNPAVLLSRIEGGEFTKSPSDKFILKANADGMTHNLPIDVILGVQSVLHALAARFPEARVDLHPVRPRDSVTDAVLRKLADGKRVKWCAESETPPAAASAPAATRPEIKMHWLENANKKVERRLRNKRREFLENGGRDYDAIWIGDSITHFWESAGNREVFREKFGDYRIFNAGFGGDKTQNLLWNLKYAGFLDGVKASMVSMMIGTNNTWADTPENIAAGIRACLKVVREKQPQATVLLHAIFPREVAHQRGERNFRRKASNVDEIMPKIQKVNELIRPLADGKRVIFVDLTAQFTDSEGLPNIALLGDGTHPNAAGYRVWADAVLPFFRRGVSGTH